MQNRHPTRDSSDYPLEEDAIKKFHYREFTLSGLDKQNIKEIEEMIAEDNYTQKRISDSLEYLTKLHHKLRDVKRVEFNYEGDENYNVNQALEHVENLIKTLEALDQTDIKKG